MKNKYTIGETASLLGISTQTLRYYDKISLLSPYYTDSKTGYRYYHYNQFHYIDRIKYLQSFGLSLDEIKPIIQSGSVDKLLLYLKRKRKQLIAEQEKLKTKTDDLSWYIDYFTYLDNNANHHTIYKVQLPVRYIIKSPCYYKEPLHDMEIRLAEVKSRKEYEDLDFRRQYGYKIDIDSLMKREFYPTEYFVYLSKDPNIPRELYDVLPAGEYVCLRTQVLKENWDEVQIREFLGNKVKPELAVALEFEDNLKEYMDAWYEVQILL